MVIYTREQKTLIIPEGLGSECNGSYDKGFEEGYNSGWTAGRSLEDARIYLKYPKQYDVYMYTFKNIYINGIKCVSTQGGGGGIGYIDDDKIDYTTLDVMPMDVHTIEIEGWPTRIPSIPPAESTYFSVECPPYMFENNQFNVTGVSYDSERNIVTINVEQDEDYIRSFYYLGARGMKDAIRLESQHLNVNSNGQYYSTPDAGEFQPVYWAETIAVPSYFNSVDVDVTNIHRKTIVGMLGQTNWEVVENSGRDLVINGTNYQNTFSYDTNMVQFDLAEDYYDSANTMSFTFDIEASESGLGLPDINTLYIFDMDATIINCTKTEVEPLVSGENRKGVTYTFTFAPIPAMVVSTKIYGRWRLTFSEDTIIPATDANHTYYYYGVDYDNYRFTMTETSGGEGTALGHTLKEAIENEYVLLRGVWIMDVLLYENGRPTCRVFPQTGEIFLNEYTNYEFPNCTAEFTHFYNQRLGRQ